MGRDLPYFVAFDPVAFQLGPLQVHWYGIMYLVAFAVFFVLASYRARRRGDWSEADVSDLLFYGAVGVIVGGRLGYVLFYDLDAVLADPLRLIKLWQGGMSFHGGLLGVLTALVWFARRSGRSFLAVSDFVVPLVPPGLFFGRIGNFIGGELYGRVADVPWAMVFPRAIDPRVWDSTALESAWRAGELNSLARHPSQLYQAGLEGLALFLILWFYSRRPRPTGAVSGLFLAGYGTFRIFVEQFRQPDGHLDFIAFGWLTMGQALSMPMVLTGALLMFLAYRGSFRERAA